MRTFTSLWEFLVEDHSKRFPFTSLPSAVQGDCCHDQMTSAHQLFVSLYNFCVPQTTTQIRADRKDDSAISL